MALVRNHSQMPTVRANGIDIHYETRGEGEPLVLIMGIGAQLVVWPEEFLQQLAERGFQVIVFDNRDVGLSSKIHGARAPGMRKVALNALLGRRVEAPYSLMDMADDTVGLMDALGLESAHIVGVSMGGMVAQTLAIVHPTRVRTLTSWMSTTGDPLVGWAKPRALRALMGPAPRNRDEAIARQLNFAKVCGSPAYPARAERLRDVAGRAFDRCHYPTGFLRQFAAIGATGGRKHALRFVRVPSLVIHGAEDPLILPSGGRATARAIPGARLEIIDGMGHDIPEPLWPQLTGLIEEHVNAAPRR